MPAELRNKLGKTLERVSREVQGKGSDADDTRLRRRHPTAVVIMPDRKAQDDDKKDDKDDDDKGSRAEENEDDDKDDDNEQKSGKKSKKAQDDDKDDDDKDDDEKSQARSRHVDPRMQERARIKAILTSEGAHANPRGAHRLAFDTNMDAEEAVAVLEAFTPEPKQEATRKDTLRDRMAAHPTPIPGPDKSGASDPNDPQAVAARIVEAGKKRRGES